MSSTTLPELLADLVAETAVLDDLLVGLASDEWRTPTPAEGWSVHDQVTHLAFFDEAAVLAATEPDRFRQQAEEHKALGDGFPDEIAKQYRDLGTSEAGAWFRSARAELFLVFGGLDGKERMPWYGPDMSVTSCVTARLMETWAHTQDVFDAFGIERAPTDRLRHIAHLGVRTFGFSFVLNGRPAPEPEVRVELEAPSGAVWSWGPESATESVTGRALDFCLVVTQRRHLDDTGLVVCGDVATEWLTIAQAFAGAPGPGREPQNRKVLQ